MITQNIFGVETITLKAVQTLNAEQVGPFQLQTILIKTEAGTISIDCFLTETNQKKENQP